MQQAQEQQIAVSSGARVALIALGANLASPFGPPQVSLRRASEHIGAVVGVVTGKSGHYQTPCFPAGAGPDYVNAALCVRSDFTADRILAYLHEIEAVFHRERIERWGARSLDLDLLALDDCVLPDAATQTTWRQLPADQQIATVPDRLILPHPRLQDRAFVLVPLCDVAPDWRHPVSDRTVREMCAALPQADRDAVTLLSGRPEIPVRGI